MVEAEKRISTSQVTVEQADEDFKIAQVRYSAGVGTNTDVIDAQVALTQAKNNYIQAMYDFNTSKANLTKAMGVPVETVK
jgi:outer membrane protein TolC